MREVRRLRPGTDAAFFAEYKKIILETAIDLLKPCKDCGRGHLAALIGNFVCETHNEMTKVCAGINQRPKTSDEQTEISTKIAATGLLMAAAIKLIEDPNTQWDDSTMFYCQLRNHLENMHASAEAAMIIRLPGDR